MKIFSGGSNPELVANICRCLSLPQGNVKLQRFPSGEEHCQFQENIRGEDVFLVQSTSNPANENLMQLLVMGDAARRASAGRITAVIPYFGYGRQDRKDKPRVPISAKLVMDLIEAAGFNRVLTMDLHAPQIGGFTNLPLDQLCFRPALVEALRNTPVDCVVAPDVGAIKRADEYATALGTDLTIITKKRSNATKVEVKQFVGDVKGKKVIIIDDLTESAGTLIEAANACKENGAKTIYCAVTHFCLTKVGEERLAKATEIKLINRVFFSNSAMVNFTSPELQTVDISGMFAEAISRIHNNQSVSSLFQ